LATTSSHSWLARKQALLLADWPMAAEAAEHRALPFEIRFVQALLFAEPF